MNAEILKRVVRAIANGSQSDLTKLASKLIETERRVGHKKLADQLENLLKHSRNLEDEKQLKKNADTELKELPLSRRYGESLATIFRPTELEHHMILPPATEQRFSRIEAEYAARERLGIYGLKRSKSILLYGPPGCGKSLGAKRLAWKTGLPLMKVRFEAIISSYFGESATNLRAIFNSAQQQPCVLLLDECDFIARSRTTGRDIGEASRIVNSLLQLMEDYEAPGFLVATTNVEGSLDSAIFRRFDEVFSVPLPGYDEIKKLLQLTLSAVPHIEAINWDRVVAELSGSSAAMVVKAAQDAAKAAVLVGKHGVSESDLQKAVSELQKNDKPRMVE